MTEDNTVENYLQDFYNAITEDQREEIRKMFLKKVVENEQDYLQDRRQRKTRFN